MKIKSGNCRRWKYWTNWNWKTEGDGIIWQIKTGKLQEMEIFDWLKTGKLQEMEGRIWQCRAGHLLCEPCKDRPEVRDKLLNWKLKGRNRKCRLTWNNLISAAMQIWPSKISFILGTRRWQPVQRAVPLSWAGKWLRSMSSEQCLSTSGE